MNRPLAAPRLTSGSRLWSSLMEMAAIGAIDGDGSCRLSLSDEDKAARDLFASWCRDAGCTLRTDPFGNMFAIRPGTRPGAPAVLVGSHLDTQPNGGRFDGVLGVLAGLEVVRALNDAGIETEHPIAVVNWTNEEGVRFKPGLTGSAGFVGRIADAPDAVAGIGGVSFFAELDRIGYRGPPLTGFDILCYYELHIEQGPVLEQAGVPIGIVTGIQGVRWFEIALVGEAGHAGTMPMANRRDSFMAASRLALELREQGAGMDEALRVTFGRVEVVPNSQNTIPGETRLFLDLRHRDSAILDRFETVLHTVAAGLMASEGVTATVTPTMVVPPVLFDAAMQQRLDDVAAKLALPSIALCSGAMHDASCLASFTPSAMLFIPSRGGTSHNPAEWSDPGQVADGCEMLARTICAHAIVASGDAALVREAADERP